jgi:hypothetical protein
MHTRTGEAPDAEQENQLQDKFGFFGIQGA